MIDEKQFNRNAAELLHKLSFIWSYTYRVLNGLPVGSREEFDRVLHEANRLHDEMFPDFERSLYGDDFLSMLDDDEE